MWWCGGVVAYERELKNIAIRAVGRENSIRVLRYDLELLCLGLELENSRWCICVSVFLREIPSLFTCGEESVPYPAPRVLRIRVQSSVFWFTSRLSCSKERSLCGGV